MRAGIASMLAITFILMIAGFVMLQCAQDRHAMAEGIEKLRSEMAQQRLQMQRHLVERANAELALATTIKQLKEGLSSSSNAAAKAPAAASPVVADTAVDTEQKSPAAVPVEPAPAVVAAAPKITLPDDVLSAIADGERDAAPGADEVANCLDPNLPTVDLGAYNLISSVPGTRLACTTGGDAVCDMIRRDGVWEPHIYFAMNHAIKAIEKKNSQKAMLLDMGGNVGAISVRIAAEGHKVHAFEMLPRNAQMIKTSKCLNKLPDDALHLYHTGLGSTERTCNMISGEKSNDGIVDCSGRTAEQIRPYRIDGVVTVKPLDAMWEGSSFGRMVDDGVPNVVKIDVEGFEIDVLEGASKLLTHQNRPKLVLTEVWPGLDFNRYATLMLKHGYVGYEYQRHSWIGDMEDAGRYQTRDNRIIDTVAWVQSDFYRQFLRTPHQGGAIRNDRQVWRRWAAHAGVPIPSVLPSLNRGNAPKTFRSRRSRADDN